MTNSPESLPRTGEERILDDKEINSLLTNVLWPSIDSIYPDGDFLENAQPGEEIDKMRRMPGVNGLMRVSLKGICFYDRSSVETGGVPPVAISTVIRIESECKDKTIDLVSAFAEDESPDVVEMLISDPGAYKPWRVNTIVVTDNSRNQDINVSEEYQLRAADNDDEIYWESESSEDQAGNKAPARGYSRKYLTVHDRMQVESALFNLGILSGLTVVREYSVEGSGTVFNEDVVYANQN